MSALDRLEKVAGITIFEKLALNFITMTSELDFPEPTVESLRKENNPGEGSKAMMEAWLSGASFLPTTWQVLLERFQAVEMRPLVDEINQFFSKSSASLVSYSDFMYTSRCYKLQLHQYALKHITVQKIFNL